MGGKRSSRVILRKDERERETVTHSREKTRRQKAFIPNGKAAKSFGEEESPIQRYEKKLSTGFPLKSTFREKVPLKYSKVQTNTCPIHAKRHSIKGDRICLCVYPSIVFLEGIPHKLFTLPLLSVFKHTPEIATGILKPFK